MTFRWRADDGPTSNAVSVTLVFFNGSGPVLLINPFCDFLRGGGGCAHLVDYFHSLDCVYNKTAVSFRVVSSISSFIVLWRYKTNINKLQSYTGTATLILNTSENDFVACDNILVIVHKVMKKR